MKKAALTILSYFCVLAMSGCGNSQTDSNVDSENSTQSTKAESVTKPESKEESGSTGNETLVVYFSATGTTKGVAERIASVTNADLYEIIPAQPYSSDDLD